MSNTIEDLIRDIIHYETEEAFCHADAFQKLKERIIEGEEFIHYEIYERINKLEERIKVLEERLEEAND